MINKKYGMPVDPRNAAIAAITGTYNSLKQPNTQYQPNPVDEANADFARAQAEEVRARMASSQSADTTIPTQQNPSYGTPSSQYIPPPAGTGTSFASYQPPAPAPVQQPQPSFASYQPPAPAQQAPVMPFPIPQMTNFPTFAMPSIAPQMPNLPSFVNNMPSIAPQMPQRKGPGGRSGARPGFRGDLF